MLPACVARALLAAGLALAAASAPALADGQPGTGTPTPAAVQDTPRWVAHSFSVVAPASMWPMLDLLHALHFDWELASAAQRPTPLVWADLPSGVFAQFDRTSNLVRLSRTLQTSSVEAGAAFLAHELTHLNDDLNGRLGHTSTACYAAETRAFENEANFWSMVFGPMGKAAPDPIEAGENMKMWAFLGNPTFADLVIRTTPSYTRECGVDQ
jgi:hypothetical protein